MPERTGTASQVDASAGDGSTNVTVPADCDLVVALWSHWDGNGFTTIASLTLDGDAFTIHAQLADGTPEWDGAGVGVATLEAPTTGASVSFAWTYSGGGARSEGGLIALVYVKGANLGDAVRDSGVHHNSGTQDVTVTIDTETTDLVIALGSTAAAFTPGLDGTVFIDNWVLNSTAADVSEVTPNAGSTTINMTGESYAGMAAVSLKEETQAPSGDDIRIGFAGRGAGW